MNVVFDTASGQVLLPSAECTSRTCTTHRQYKKSQSYTGYNINTRGELEKPQQAADGGFTITGSTITIDSIDVGSGDAEGPLVMDKLCLSGEGWRGQQACTTVGFVAAASM